MRKLFVLGVLGLLTLSSVGVGAVLSAHPVASCLNQSIVEQVVCAAPGFSVDQQGFVFVSLPESSTMLASTGDPVLPMITRSYRLPFGTTITSVKVTFDDIKDYVLPGRIAPAPAPVADLGGRQVGGERIANEAVYGGSGLYPGDVFTYSLHAGLNGRSHVVIVDLECFPVRYLPGENVVVAAGRVNIRVEYRLPQHPITFPDVYDLVVIAPEKFSSALQPLVDHKNSMGVRTVLKTTESIYSAYEGRDQPEKIKYFLKDAIESWNVSYALLVGGMKSLLFGNWGVDGPGTSKDDSWYVPVRYSNLVGLDESQGFLTDLYFADVYKVVGNQTVFDDWDSNGNGIFAEWNLDAKDILDLYPDIYVGRLPCETTFEVQQAVKNIISYESTAADPSWFNRVVVAGGDSFDDRPPLGQDYYEGEVMGDLAISYLPDCTPVRLWASHRDSDPSLTPTTKNIIREVSKGCGFLYFSGHGSPSLWNTHWVHDYTWNDTPGGINVYQMMLLHNGGKLPVCVVAACHNSEFNMSFFDFRKNIFTFMPTPECWSWCLARKLGGGSIATIGYTGVEWCATYGWDNDTAPDCTEYFSGYLDSRFFHAYGIDGVHHLGEAWGQAVTEYLDRFPGMAHAWDCKTASEWILFGDPSLMIGGYQ